LHALSLQSQHDDDVGVSKTPVEVVKDLHPKAFYMGWQERFGGDYANFPGSQDIQGMNL
jgi:hypothetical protein